MEAVVTDVLDPSVVLTTVCWVETLSPSRLAGGYEGCPRQAEILELRQQCGYYKSMHQRACQRENDLKQKVEELQAKLRLRERQLFGRKSEKSNSADTQNNKQITSPHPKRPRGQQLGSTGHGRRDYSHLPAEDEVYDLSEEDRRCSRCGLPAEEFPGTEDSEDSQQIEIEVRAYRRVIHRKRYQPTCQCEDLPGIITAPGPAKLIPKGLYGVSVWVTILLDKYCFLRPTYRLLEDLKTHGLNLSLGTITGGLKRLAPLFEPIMEGIKTRNLEETQWHADETRWLMFCTIEGKVGYKWYMWVFESPSAVVYVLDPSRSAKVPEKHFQGVEEGILIVDRYAAYKAMSKVKSGKILLAFCWDHVRRDFLGVAKDWPAEQSWGLAWVEMIGELYHLNKRRLEVRSEPTVFTDRDQQLRDAVDQMAQRRDEQLSQSDLHPARRKALESLRNHWKGLTLFVDRPEIPMNNSQAERRMRPLAVARKVFYGSGAQWVGHLAATLFSIFATLGLWKLNPRKWLTVYLQACADNGGKAPPNAATFLPWNLSEQQRPRVGRVAGHQRLFLTAINSSQDHKDAPMRYCGRQFTAGDLQQIRQIMAQSPHCNRAQLSRLVCQCLSWHKLDGGLKEMSCRVAMLRMQADGLLTRNRSRVRKPDRVTEGPFSPSRDRQGVVLARGANHSLTVAALFYLWFSRRLFS